MNITNILSLPFRYKPWRPYHLRLILADLAGTARQPERDNETHLKSAINWLCRAQDLREGKSDSGGVSAGWSFEDGWLPSYPETSGYIVETFIAASKLLNQPDLLHRAHRILDWELSIQNADGSFPGHFGEPGSRPVIFNTGQIMHGLVSGYVELNRQECLQAAVKAGRWLVEQQDSDGCWRQSTHNAIFHTYNTRAAWALLRVGLISNEMRFQKAAVQNLNWALTQQTESGWFASNAFTSNRPPFTHTIAYAIRGFLESGLLISEERFIAAAEKAARAMANAQRDDGWLAGTFEEGWVPSGHYCCLTGLAQMSIIWKRLIQTCAVNEMHSSVERALGYLKRNHMINGRSDPQDGGVAGSVPIWGGYSRFEYPNWAAKFFADALMTEMTDTTIPQGVNTRP